MKRPTAGDLYKYENVIFGGTSINVQPFLDTGASTLIISDATADLLRTNISQPSTALPRTPGVQFSDVGVGGSTVFDVTPPLGVRIAPSSSEQVDNPATYTTVYNQAYAPMRIAIGPTNVVPDPLSDPLDVFGMPVMMGKTVVMDPKPLNDLTDLMHTYLYEPGTPFNPAAASTNPGIPTTSHHVKLSYGDFGRFTETTPAGADPPAISHNPFIGPDPLLKLADNPPPDDTPPVDVAFGGHHASGSFLLDTGAAASFISTEIATSLGVRYGPALPGGDPQLETFDLAHPELPGTPIENQFQVPIQGIGGVVNIAGFFLDEMLLQTMEGSLDPADPNNLKYLGAPVLVHDITAIDPNTGDELTLDGVFGMNFLVASIAIDFGDARTSPFNWITFDEPNGILGLDLVDVPEPNSVVLAGAGLGLLVVYARRRRRRR